MSTQSQQEGRPPFPPFTAETAQKKVKAAQDAWNTKWGNPYSNQVGKSNYANGRNWKETPMA